MVPASASVRAVTVITMNGADVVPSRATSTWLPGCSFVTSASASGDATARTTTSAAYDSPPRNSSGFESAGMFCVPGSSSWVEVRT